MTASVGRPKQDKLWTQIVGKWIRECRQTELSVSQEELGKMLGVTRTTVNKWESGKVSPPIRKMVGLYRMTQLARQGVADRQKLYEEAAKVCFTDVEGMLESVMSSYAPSNFKRAKRKK
ncbi:MAG: helix-turn-helix domain-containing protein [Abditibacteriales bacterium]|nr:helix-turn-helix domain-containing protein [Abditibacteriales bacterium]MDW8365012.1 helix-turn-helix transcriptional regulator [Abditibacteriales bacterium]